jgi:hypothetical protein
VILFFSWERMIYNILSYPLEHYRKSAVNAKLCHRLHHYFSRLPIAGSSLLLVNISTPDSTPKGFLWRGSLGPLGARDPFILSYPLEHYRKSAVNAKLCHRLHHYFSRLPIAWSLLLVNISTPDSTPKGFLWRGSLGPLGARDPFFFLAGM